MQPIRRDVSFDFPADRICDWHGDGVGVTQFLNALSTVFPAGERFFIASVRNYRDQITDPELKAAVTAFIGQEAMHGREHEHWNECFFRAVPRARGIEARASRRLKRWQRWLPRSTQLAMTIGAEHFTAVLGDFVLRHPQFLEGHGSTRSLQVFVDMLKWHAMEETEHKAVAFDVWRSVMRRTPRAYVERCLGMVIMYLAYLPVINELVVEGLKAQGDQIDLPRELARVRAMLYGENGLMRGIVLPLLSYARPGFHPWDEDNRALLGQMAEIEAAYA